MGVRVWVAVLLHLLTQAVSVSPAPIISTPWGQINGVVSESSAGEPYNAYLAIPYALPPVGERRFAKPVAHPGSEEGQVYSAVEPGPMCPQLDPFAQGISSEDCLTLDVHVPIGADGSNSVIIYIHGGSFISWGSRIFTPSELVTENDVIVVVIQYRLGPLGFLSSGDDALPGNYGLWDQNLAIRWVKDNIRGFGGDPESITLYGQSAGAVSIGHQLLSPQSKGLFSRVVLQSGSPTAAWAVQEDPLKAFKQLARAAGCAQDEETRTSLLRLMLSLRNAQEETEKTVQCLRAVDVQTLLFLSVLPLDSLRSSELIQWAPVVDGDFVPQNPSNLLRDVDYLSANDVISRDVMLGVTNEEGGYMLAALEGSLQLRRALNPGADFSDLEKLLSISSASERSMIREELLYRYADRLKRNPGKALDTTVDVLEFFYTKPLVDGQIAVKDATDTFGDIYFNVPLVSIARSLAQASGTRPQDSQKGSLYVYKIDHYPARKAAAVPFKGLTHGEDIFYVFDNPYFSRAGFDADDLAVGRTLRGALADFAKTGNPATSVDLAPGGPWPQYSLAGEKYLSLGPQSTVADRLYAKRVALWLDLVPNTLLADQMN